MNKSVRKLKSRVLCELNVFFSEEFIFSARNANYPEIIFNYLDKSIRIKKNLLYGTFRLIFLKKRADYPNIRDQEVYLYTLPKLFFKFPDCVDVMSDFLLRAKPRIIMNLEQVDEQNQKYDWPYKILKFIYSRKLLPYRTIPERKIIPDDQISDIINKVLSRRCPTDRIPFLDPGFMGNERAEENRKKIVTSREFKAFIKSKSQRINKIRPHLGLSKLLGVENDVVEIKYELIKLDVFKDYPISQLTLDQALEQYSHEGEKGESFLRYCKKHTEARHLIKEVKRKNKK